MPSRATKPKPLPLATVEPFTANQLRVIATALLAARPPVFEGTRFIINDTRRKVWYDCVSELSMVFFPKLSKENAETRSAFFDTAGVPD